MPASDHPGPPQGATTSSAYQTGIGAGEGRGLGRIGAKRDADQGVGDNVWLGDDRDILETVIREVGRRACGGTGVPRARRQVT